MADTSRFGVLSMSGLTPEQRLERGDVLFYRKCPFELPAEDDRDFLLEQRLASSAHKNIGFNPHNDKTTGFAHHSTEQATRLQSLLRQFADRATDWLTQQFPLYASGWARDRVSFRPEEESTRVLRLSARNDLLHVDAFPNRPTQGHRIFRFFVNINRTEPRIWITGPNFQELLDQFGHEVGLPTAGSVSLPQRLKIALQGMVSRKRRDRTVYDRFMLRFHHFLKANGHFQMHCQKRHWAFPPGSAWMCFTDGCSHAALKGRFALEHSYLIAPQTLVLPDESPSALLEKPCGRAVLRKGA